MTSEIRTKIIELLRRGWTQNTAFRDINGKSISNDVAQCYPDKICQVCLIGAIKLATDFNYPELLRVIHEVEGKTKSFVSVFNDKPGRTVEEVIAVVEQV